MKALYWLLVGLIPSSTIAQNFNYAQRFPKNKLYNLEPKSIGLDKIDGTIAAFGDFNSDKFTDVFVLSSDQTSVSVYLWDHHAFSFKTLSATKIIQPGFIVTNVIPGDYNYDGKLDVLLMGEQNPDKKSGSEIEMQVYFGNGNDSFVSQSVKLPSAINSLPIVADINGDMKTDILGYDFKTGELSVWLNQALTESNDTSALFNLTSAAHFLDSSLTEKCIWSNPHSNAFVDLDGDCLADLVFVCSKSSGSQSIQIWTNQRQDGFQHSQTLELPTGSGPISFGDLNGDGTIDIVYPVCHAACHLEVLYNQQIGLCRPEHPTDCRKARDLCQPDPTFHFDQRYLLEMNQTIMLKDEGFRGELPIPVQVGDYNLDGYPDLLVTTEKEGVVLLRSVVCETCEGGRSFVEVKTGVEDLKMKGARQVAFFDIDEDGSLDMLVLQDQKLKDAERTPHFIINNFFNDAFFLKGLVSNGVDNLEAYGVSYPGASLKFTVLDTEGVKRSHQVSQLSQSGYLSLQTPYCLFGLGRTNNYVEEMFAGVSRHQTKNYLFYEGVIPNSQLVFLPHQPEGVQDSTSWIVELYITPAAYVPWVFVVLIAASILLAIVVVVLRSIEKREDEMERRKALHIINFDAL